MANTERLHTLRVIRETKRAVMSTRLNSELGLKAAQKKILEQLFVVLERIEDELIIRELGEAVAALEADSKALKAINAKIKDEIERLEGLVEMVDTAADVLKILVDAAAKLAGAGLI